MILALYIVGSILAYATVGLWTFGYCCAKWVARDNEGNSVYYRRESNFYYGSPGAWFAGIFWPVYLFCSYVLKHWGWFMIRSGESVAIKSAQAKKIRIEIEQKIRVEQDKIQREAEAEIEAMLRKSSAA
jgi:hypothetical protein